MADLFLAFGVLCNSVSIILLLIQIRRLRRERGLSVEDLKNANRLQSFAESMNEKGCAIHDFFEDLSRKDYEQ